MTLCDYDSSSDSDRSTASCLSDGNIRYPVYNGTSGSRKYATSSKKRTWSETDDESDLPGVPDYQAGGSSARFCYDSDEAEFENSRDIKRRRTSNNRSVVPIGRGLRDLIKCPAPAPRSTTALRPSVRQPSASRFINSLDEDLEYLTIHDLPSINESELKYVPAAVRPPQIRPSVHVYPAPKPTTAVTVRLRKAASPAEPKVVVPKWLGVASTWSFPSS
ncbi:uncharacterized protein B0T23DRAFT_439331 [Neurospora hispaniola]|uniref:Uncharacterized protein n=1 Tax=Neurospora hispaniola TaxID=588809 RepID=A0AAJ0IF46_9PEZI|nr:hypothetical protein B0T23DRAFT_439331 [Neurospora hispaniola]